MELKYIEKSSGSCRTRSGATARALERVNVALAAFEVERKNILSFEKEEYREGGMWESTVKLVFAIDK